MSKAHGAENRSAEGPAEGLQVTADRGLLPESGPRRLQDLAAALQGLGPPTSLARPNARRSRGVAEQLSNVAFRELFETWLSNGVTRKDGNAELSRTFERNILPSVGAKRLRDVTDEHLLDALRRVGRFRGRERTAERMIAELRQMFRWALKRQP